VLVLVGAYLTNGWPFPLAAYQAAIAMWCVTAYGYVSNDYTDLAEDRINKPDRPLPAGVIRPIVALNLASLLALGAISWSLWLGWLATAIASIVLGLLTLYNYRLKGIPGGGNLVIALLAGSTLWVGGVAVHGLQPKAFLPLLPATLILSCFVLTREILKTIEDIEGDSFSGQQTFAVRWGWHYASHSVIGLAFSTLLMIFWSYLYLDYSNIYLAKGAISLVFWHCSLRNDTSHKYLSIFVNFLLD